MTPTDPGAARGTATYPTHRPPCTCGHGEASHAFRMVARRKVRGPCTVMFADQRCGCDSYFEAAAAVASPPSGAIAAIGEAIAIAEQFGQTDGAHHKAWVIDQMVRALVGVDYEHWRAAYEADGEVWDEGTAP